MENELPKLRIDSTGNGFYQADDADDEGAVCEYSKAITIISQLHDEIALLKKGCPFEAENERLIAMNKGQSAIIGECEASVNALTIKNEWMRKQVEKLKPKVVRVQRSYMRDNHTFLMLSENDEEAIAQLCKEYAAGNNWGLLSVTVHLSNGKEGSRSGYDIVPGTETWATFKPIAESWLKRSHIGKEPADGQ